LNGGHTGIFGYITRVAVPCEGWLEAAWRLWNVVLLCPDRLAQLGEVDALAVARHLLQDRERPLKRLDAAALPGRLGPLFFLVLFLAVIDSILG
jgi:hypothetical protein